MGKLIASAITEILKSKQMLVLVVAFGFFGLINNNDNSAFAAVTEWNSDISVGILELEESENETNLRVTAYSNTELKLEWDAPNLSEDKFVAGYKILRNTINTDYVTIVENTNSTETVYFDSSLPTGYYGYKIIPLIQSKPSEPITMHGIDRNNNLFEMYLIGQELLAQNQLSKILNEKSIQNTFSEEPKTHYSEFLKRSENLILQSTINNEILKAQQIFDEKFNIKINH